MPQNFTTKKQVVHIFICWYTQITYNTSCFYQLLFNLSFVVTLFCKILQRKCYANGKTFTFQILWYKSDSSPIIMLLLFLYVDLGIRLLHHTRILYSESLLRDAPLSRPHSRHHQNLHFRLVFGHSQYPQNQIPHVLQHLQCSYKLL